MTGRGQTTRRRWGLRVVALASVATLAIVGCAPDGGADDGESAPTIITANGSEPLNPLITFGLSETNGRKIMADLYAGLVSFDAQGGIENEVAESIETEDSQTFTITLEEGWTFTNGEEITAQTFVDTWIAAAQDPAGASWFAGIEGASEDGTTEPTGLEVVDEFTFTVALKEPEADFPIRLASVSYMPLPSVAFEDLGAFGENPIGNGPYMLDGEGAWRHDEGISMVTNPDYSGNRVPANDGLEMVFYTDLGAAYADVQSGNLDVLDSVPDTQLSTFETEFEGRHVNQPGTNPVGVRIPYYLERFEADDEGELRRAAISMAINREEIIETIFNGSRTLAADFTSPLLDGWTDQLEGADVLEYNPDEAQRLWAEADAISPYDDTFTIAYSTDGDHQTWVDAVANQLSNTLGIQAEGQPYPTFAASLEARIDQTLTGATYAGQTAEFPARSNLLYNPFATDGLYNIDGYSSEAFDAKMDEAASAPSPEDSNSLIDEAQEILLIDLPNIPLWYNHTLGVWDEGVENVEFGWDGIPIYTAITK